MITAAEMRKIAEEGMASSDKRDFEEWIKKIEEQAHKGYTSMTVFLHDGFPTSFTVRGLKELGYKVEFMRDKDMHGWLTSYYRIEW